MGNIRRSKGYSFEKSIVERFNKKKDWNATRLGGTTTNLPDVLITNNNTFISLEAKSSGISKKLYVPFDQIKRCVSIHRMFNIYSNKYVIFAFKFAFNKKDKIRRELREYFFIIKPVWLQITPLNINCDYDGIIHFGKNIVSNIGIIYTNIDGVIDYIESIA